MSGFSDLFGGGFYYAIKEPAFPCIQRIRRQAIYPCYHFFLSVSHETDLFRYPSVPFRYNRRNLLQPCPAKVSGTGFGALLRSHLPHIACSIPLSLRNVLCKTSTCVLSSSLLFPYGFRLSYESIHVKHKIPTSLFASQLESSD